MEDCGYHAALLSSHWLGATCLVDQLCLPHSTFTLRPFLILQSNLPWTYLHIGKHKNISVEITCQMFWDTASKQHRRTDRSLKMSDSPLLSPLVYLNEKDCFTFPLTPIAAPSLSLWELINNGPFGFIGFLMDFFFNLIHLLFSLNPHWIHMRSVLLSYFQKRKLKLRVIAHKWQSWSASPGLSKFRDKTLLTLHLWETEQDNVPLITKFKGYFKEMEDSKVPQRMDASLSLSAVPILNINSLCLCKHRSWLRRIS